MKEKIKKHKSPIIIFILLTFGIIVLSGVFSFLGVQAEYSTINTVTNKLNNNVVQADNILSGSGIKSLVVNTVNDFVNFTPFSMLLIILIGFGILEKSGFLKTGFTLLTQHVKKNTITFMLVFLCLMFSMLGNIGFVVMIPLCALLFKYGKRNPLGGIILAFASLSFGQCVNLFISAIDSNMMSLSTNTARMLDPKYLINPYFKLFVMIVALLLFAFMFTYITEKVIMTKLNKGSEDEIEDIKVSNKELRGLIVGLGVGCLYVVIIAYFIIPGLPLSGLLLDNTATLYVDKLLGANSFFNQGFIFIVTILFILVGFFYGIFAKTIKSSKDVTDSFGASLDGIGNTIVLIFFASIFINVFKMTNIGTVISAFLATVLSSLNFTGVGLIIILFIFAIISGLFNPSTVGAWAIFSGSAVPTFMNASISPEFAQLVFTFGNCALKGLTPLFSFFIIYLAFAQKYDNREGNVFVNSIKNMLPYAACTIVICFVLVVGWYITGLPIGINTLPGVTYAA
ncbi:MAG: AbgT family transporter [Bacilli bacterium]